MLRPAIVTVRWASVCSTVNGSTCPFVLEPLRNKAHEPCLFEFEVHRGHLIGDSRRQLGLHCRFDMLADEPGDALRLR